MIEANEATLCAEPSNRSARDLGHPYVPADTACQPVDISDGLGRRIATVETCPGGPCCSGADPDGRLYTLAEAEAELARRKCDREGHRSELVLDPKTREPIALMCLNVCGHRGYRVIPIGDVDPRAMLIDVCVDLWHDLAAAYRFSEASPRETSVACHGLIKRIQDIARVAGPVPAGTLEYEMLLTGLYETVHAEVGVEADVPDELLAAARKYVEAGGVLTDGRSRGLHSEVRDRRVYYGTDPDGTRYYLATDRGGWLPGEFDSPEAAGHAFDVPRETLDELAGVACGDKRRITIGDLTAAMSALKSAVEQPAEA